MRYLNALTPALAAVLLSGVLISDAAAATPRNATVGLPPAAAIARAQSQLLDAERRRAQAVASRDVDAMRSLISGEYYHVESNGRVRTKTQYLQMLGRDEFEFQSYEIDDVDVSLPGNGRVAVVTGRLVAQVKAPNRPRDFRARFVRVWVLDGDIWRNTLHQTTEIKPGAAQRDGSQTSAR